MVFSLYKFWSLLQYFPSLPDSNSNRAHIEGLGMCPTGISFRVVPCVRECVCASLIALVVFQDNCGECLFFSFGLGICPLSLGDYVFPCTWKEQIKWVQVRYSESIPIWLNISEIMLAQMKSGEFKCDQNNPSESEWSGESKFVNLSEFKWDQGNPSEFKWKQLDSNEIKRVQLR